MDVLEEADKSARDIKKIVELLEVQNSEALEARPNLPHLLTQAYSSEIERVVKYHKMSEELLIQGQEHLSDKNFSEVKKTLRLAKKCMETGDRISQLLSRLRKLAHDKLKRHNDMVFPALPENAGRLLKSHEAQIFRLLITVRLTGKDVSLVCVHMCASVRVCVSCVCMPVVFVLLWTKAIFILPAILFVIYGHFFLPSVPYMTVPLDHLSFTGIPSSEVYRLIDKSYFPSVSLHILTQSVLVSVCRARVLMK